TLLFRIVADRCTSWWPSFRRWRREQSCCRHSFSRGRRTDERDGFSLVSAIDAEILAVHSDDAVARIKLGHTDKTKVGEVGFAVGVTLRQNLKLWQVVVAVPSVGKDL